MSESIEANYVIVRARDGYICLTQDHRLVRDTLNEVFEWITYWEQELTMAPIWYDRKIQGWSTPAELLWLYLNARKMKNVVEVGSWKGRSTYSLLAGCHGLVYAVDHFKGSAAELDSTHKEATEHDIRPEFDSNVGGSPNLRVLAMDSLKVAATFDDKAVDMVFIDGGHQYDEVVADIKAWLPKTRRLICGHDYHNPEVKRAVDDCVPFVRQGVHNIWYKWVGAKP